MSACYITCAYACLQVGLLESEDEVVVEQVTRALGNLALGSNDFRNPIADEGGLPPLVALLKSKNPTVAENAAWALGTSGFIGGQPRPMCSSSTFVCQ